MSDAIARKGDTPALHVAHGFWPGLLEGEPDHYYISFGPTQPYLSDSREPTEAEVAYCVRAINAWSDPAALMARLAELEGF